MTEDLHPLLRGVRDHLNIDAPFFAHLLILIPFREIPEDEARDMRANAGVPEGQLFPTAYLRLLPTPEIGWYRPFVDGLTFPQALGVVIHELLHLVHLSHARFDRSRYPASAFELWNVAADVAINQDILRATVGGKRPQLPPTDCTLEVLRKRGYRGVAVHEPVMDFLMDTFCPERERGPRALKRASRDAVASLQPIDQHVFLEEESQDDEAQTLARHLVQTAVNRIPRTQWGRLSAHLVDRILESLRPPKVLWKNELRHLLQYELGGMVDPRRSWCRPGRRVGLPLKIGASERIVVAVDTSGSVFTHESFQEFLAEVDAVSVLASVRLVLFDAEVLKEWDYRPGDFRRIARLGGGGTSVQCVFDYMKAKELRQSLVVFLTDGIFDYGYETHGVRRVLWAVLVRDDERLDPSCGGKTGRTVHIEGRSR